MERVWCKWWLSRYCIMTFGSLGRYEATLISKALEMSRCGEHKTKTTGASADQLIYQWKWMSKKQWAQIKITALHPTSCWLADKQQSLNPSFSWLISCSDSLIFCPELGRLSDTKTNQTWRENSQSAHEYDTNKVELNMILLSSAKMSLSGWSSFNLSASAKVTRRAHFTVTNYSFTIQLLLKTLHT